MKWIPINGKNKPIGPLTDTGRRLESKPLLLRGDDGRFRIGKYISMRKGKSRLGKFDPFFMHEPYGYEEYTHFMEIEEPDE